MGHREPELRPELEPDTEESPPPPPPPGRRAPPLARPPPYPPSPGPRPCSPRAGIGPAADPTLPLRGAQRTRPSAPAACSPAPPPGSQRAGTGTAPTSEILPRPPLCGPRTGARLWKLKPGPLKSLLRGGAPARGRMGGRGSPDGGWGRALLRNLLKVLTGKPATPPLSARSPLNSERALMGSPGPEQAWASVTDPG